MGVNTGGIRVFPVPSSGPRVVMCCLPGFLLDPRCKCHCCPGSHTRTPRLREAGPLFHRGSLRPGSPAYKSLLARPPRRCGLGTDSHAALSTLGLWEAVRSLTMGGDRQLRAGAPRGFGQFMSWKWTLGPPTFRRSSQKPGRAGERPCEVAAFGAICEEGTDSSYPRVLDT